MSRWRKVNQNWRFFSRLPAIEATAFQLFSLMGLFTQALFLWGWTFYLSASIQLLKKISWKKQHKHEPLTESQPKLKLFQPTARYQSNSISVVFVDGAVHPSVGLVGLDAPFAAAIHFFFQWKKSNSIRFEVKKTNPSFFHIKSRTRFSRSPAKKAHQNSAFSLDGVVHPNVGLVGLDMCVRPLSVFVVPPEI